jgi:hypothetical protein
MPETYERYEWMDPLNMIVWRKAIKARETRVTTRDGREYNLEYRKRVSHIDGKKYDVVFINPAGDSKIRHYSSFVPCGWFPLTRFDKPNPDAVVESPAPAPATEEKERNHNEHN